MTVRMISPFEFSVHTRGIGSTDPEGRPDVRWRNGIEPTYRTTLDLEFERDDLSAIRSLVWAAGGYFPRELHDYTPPDITRTFTPDEFAYLRDLLNGEIGIRPGAGLTGDGVLKLKEKFKDA